MLRRRTVFSTPFVVVLGCSQPAERPITPGSGRGSETQVASVPDDAAADRSNEEIRNRIMDAQTRCVPSLERNCGNPPAPDAWVQIVIEARVIARQPRERGIGFTVAIPVGQSVRKGWKGVFLDGTTSIAGTEFEIERASERSFEAFLAGKRDLPSDRVRVISERDR